MPKVIFIVGMHRSGTSALSGALRFCGFEHGGALMPPQPDNLGGFFEQLPIVRFNNRLLAMAGIRWDHIPLTLDFSTLAPQQPAVWALEGAAEAASLAWDATFADTAGDVVCKDPRLALTLPLWLKVAESKGYSPEVLITHRAPLAIIASLQRRNGMDFAAAAALVADYWVEMLANAPPDARVVSYAPFAAAPDKTLAALGHRASSEAAAAEMRAFVRAPAAVPTLPAGIVPAPLRVFDKVLQATHGKSPNIDGSLLRSAMREHEHRKHYTGQTYMLGPVPKPNFSRGIRPRTVVLHCHIFKNAGSSVDVLLKDHFGPRWATKEFPARSGISNADLTNTYIRAHDEFDVLSTHTGDWWLGHDGGGLKVMPIIFLRHPLLRIRSAYSFERKQAADTLGARLAKMHDFAGYVRARLQRKEDFAFRDFQARRLAAFDSRVTTDLASTAMRALERAPYIGLVEDFDRSAQRLESYLSPCFEGFRSFGTRTNVTDKSGATPAEKLTRMRDEMGETLYSEVYEANSVDLALYETAVARFGTSAPIDEESLMANHP